MVHVILPSVQEYHCELVFVKADHKVVVVMILKCDLAIIPAVILRSHLWQYHQHQRKLVQHLE